MTKRIVSIGEGLDTLTKEVESLRKTLQVQNERLNALERGEVSSRPIVVDHSDDYEKGYRQAQNDAWAGQT